MTSTASTGVLPYREARDEEDEKHVHPLQLDVIDRAVVLWSNPGETRVDPVHGRRLRGLRAPSQLAAAAIGVELKPSYYRQAVKNLAAIEGDPTRPTHARIDYKKRSQRTPVARAPWMAKNPQRNIPRSVWEKIATQALRRRRTSPASPKNSRGAAASSPRSAPKTARFS